MNPQTVNKLRENIPELRELIAFLASEANKLDTLQGLDTMPIFERSYEITARLRAKQTIDAILAPLLGDVDNPVGVDPKEYVI